MVKNNEDYSKRFSEEKFWDKILKFGKQAGVKLTYGALLLFYTFKKPTVPKKVKSTILGALGYFILPLDFIPDFTPIVGYSDDLAIVVGALLVVATYIDANTKQLAKNKVVDWFGENAVNDTDSLDDEMEKSVQDRKEKKEKKIESKKIKKNIKGLKKENKKSVNE
ncbi:MULTISPECIES: YkvA family protein [unclassified Sporosarcina]|uniref:YkvA family protein n=1 Tax=unclassified Sporosarcina TaxID=2647733 RepID=UPI001E562F50|nr:MULTISPECIES: YkvA family protein [unclassified Sporosarcina]